MRVTSRSRKRPEPVRSTIPADQMQRIASAAVTRNVVIASVNAAVIAARARLTAPTVAPVTTLARGPDRATATLPLARHAPRAIIQLPFPPLPPRATRDVATRAAAAARRATATRPPAAAPVAHAAAVAAVNDPVVAIAPRRRVTPIARVTRRGNDHDRVRRRLRTNSSDARMARLLQLSLRLLLPLPSQRLLRLRLPLRPLLHAPTLQQLLPPLPLPLVSRTAQRRPPSAAPCRP